MVPSTIYRKLGLWLALATAVPCFGQKRRLSGRILAYDPIFHIVKVAPSIENQEIVILQMESKGHQTSYVKLVVHGFGQVQIPDRYFTSAEILTVRATRDSSCDQKSVEFVTKLADIPPPAKKPDGTVNVPRNSGKFMVSGSFRDRSLPALSNLECYSLETAKEQQ